MVIVVNVRSWKRQQLTGFETYMRRLLLKMVAEHTEHRFYFLSDEPIDWKDVLPSHVTGFVLGPAAKQPLLQKYWFDIKLPMWLRKVQADVVVSLDGMGSLTTRVPQCLVVQDLGYLQTTGRYSKDQRTFYKRRMPGLLKKAKVVIVPSAYFQSKLAVQYKRKESHTSLMAFAVSERFQPVSYEVKESVKAIFTQGHEYFLYKGFLHEDYNLVQLLKAFSFFKKRQQSNWKLVLAGSFQEGHNSFLQLLETYKYKEDVIVTGPLGAAEEAEVVAAAYALISPATTETVDTAIGEAMQAGIPALVANTATNKELFGDNVLFFDGHNPANMSEWIMHLYRQEGERKEYIQKGKQVVSAWSWEVAAAALWQSVLQAANG